MSNVSIEDAWKKFGIENPISDLATHADPAMRRLVALGRLYGEMSSTLEQHFSAIALIGYKFGRSAGRVEALENPAKAMQDEVQDLLNSGVREEDLHSAMYAVLRKGHL